MALRRDGQEECRGRGWCVLSSHQERLVTYYICSLTENVHVKLHTVYDITKNVESRGREQ